MHEYNQIKGAEPISFSLLGGLYYAFCISLFDFDFITSQTPEKIKMSAMPCGTVKTLSPVRTLTMTDTTGCT